MPLDKITVDSISANAVTNVGIANGTIVTVDLADQAVIGSKLGLGAISGNNISTNSIRGNNIVAGQITSNVLASNLSISVTRVVEKANINSITIGGNVNINVTENTHFFFDANTTANVTFNLRANTQNTFDSIIDIGDATSISVTVKHGTDRHEANLAIDGVVQTNVFYSANVKPSQVAITSGEINRFAYTIYKTAANTYSVLASNTLYALG
jgi:hypothetical protein